MGALGLWPAREMPLKINAYSPHSSLDWVFEFGKSLPLLQSAFCNCTLDYHIHVFLLFRNQGRRPPQCVPYYIVLYARDSTYQVFFQVQFLNKRCHLESGHSFPKRSLEGNIWGKVQRNRFVYEESPEKMLT